MQRWLTIAEKHQSLIELGVVLALVGVGVLIIMVSFAMKLGDVLHALPQQH